MAKIKEVRIDDGFITLGQFLKIAGLIDSGGQARLFLNENEVLVNGEVEQRRGRKLHENDQIEIREEVYRICR